MKNLTLIFTLLFGLSAIAFSFGQSTVEQQLEEIVSTYTDKIEQAVTLSSCGHAFDGPAAFVKQTENAWLDALLYVTADYKKSIGREIYLKNKAQGKINNTHVSYAKTQEILTALVKQTKRSGAMYRLNILKSAEINAFATLGGYLYVTTGLLNFVESYDELAFIIGHEIAHEELKHTQRKVTKLTMYDYLNFSKLEKFGQIAKGISGTLSPPFDQIDEYEADRYGFYLAKNAGYNVSKFADFFVKLERYEKKDIMKKLSSTHPYASHRKKCVQTYISN